MSHNRNVIWATISVANKTVRLRIQVSTLHSQKYGHQQVCQAKVSPSGDVLRNESKPLVPLLTAYNISMDSKFVLVLGILLGVSARRANRQLLPKRTTLVVNRVAPTAGKDGIPMAKVKCRLSVLLP